MENNKYIILDGAMGTKLQEQGLPLGERPEIYGMEHPEAITRIHREYIEAGSDVIYANTFGANRHKLEGTGVSPREAILTNIAAAKQAAEGTGCKVALDVGPIGELLEPLGTLSFEDAYDIYSEMVMAGEEAGADLVIFETFTDLMDMKAAVLAAKEHSSLLVWCTMSFEKNGRTFTGTSVASMALTLTGLGADAIGINCSLGPQEIYPLAKELMQWTTLPVIIKPNAGLPDPASGKYIMSPGAFAREMEMFSAMGVYALGGCCGSTERFIGKLAEARDNEAAMKDMNTQRAAASVKRGICSAGQVVPYGGVHVVGERLNPTGKKRFQQALREHDMDYILQRAIEQAEAGAQVLDINVGVPGLDEVSLMRDVVLAVQSVVSLPLQIDSSNPEAIEAGLRACNGRAIVNSVNGKSETLETILPLVKKYGAAVIGLTMDEQGIPKSAQQRIAIAQRIVDAALSHGISKEDVIIDCLTLTVSAQQEQAKETLQAVRYVSQEMGLHCTLGVSNISFGLPQRGHITENFLIQAMYCGLDFPIVNPNQKQIMDAVYSFQVLSGEDVDSAAYIQRFSQVEETIQTSTALELTIEEAIRKGLKEETARLASQLLLEMDEITLINTRLIPALDEVGRLYEKQVIFLPQLINAANAAGQAFELIKERIASRGEKSVSKGRIVMATVQGDIHDIGKNIVKVILENYGYQIIDLGRDVPVEKVVETVVKEDIKLVGLSALMTTTVVSMADTIQALRQSGHDCKIWVGGAVLTPEYAAEIGADYYAADARESVEIAKEVFQA